MNFERWHVIPATKNQEMVLVWKMSSGKFFVAQQHGDGMRVYVQVALLDFDPKVRWRHHAPHNLFINSDSYTYTKPLKQAQYLGNIALKDPWQWFDFVSNPAPFLMEFML